MKIILDTQILLWLQTEPQRLDRHMALLKDASTEMLVSAASSREIAIKHGLGRLPLPESPERCVPRRLQAIGAQPPPIEHPHALAVWSLPPLHRDPFDRVLVAQARALGVPSMSADPAVTQYPVQSLMP